MNLCPSIINCWILVSLSSAKRIRWSLSSSSSVAFTHSTAVAFHSTSLGSAQILWKYSDIFCFVARALLLIGTLQRCKTLAWLKTKVSGGRIPIHHEFMRHLLELHLPNGSGVLIVHHFAFGRVHAENLTLQGRKRRLDGRVLDEWCGIVRRWEFKQGQGGRGDENVLDIEAGGVMEDTCHGTSSHAGRNVINSHNSGEEADITKSFSSSVTFIVASSALS